MKKELEIYFNRNVEDYKVRIDNLYNEERNGPLHQLGDKLRKFLRAVGARRGAHRVDYTDIGGDVRNIVSYMLPLLSFFL